MFVDIKVGDRVYVKTVRKLGKVVQAKSAFCVVKLDDGGEVSPHKLDLTVVTEDNAEPYNPVGMLADFHRAFKYKRSETPVVLSAEEVFKRIVFIQEELIELLAASVDTVGEFSNYYDELQMKEEEAYFKERPKVDEYEQNNINNPMKMNAELAHDEVQRIINQSDALVDILYFTYGTADISSVDLRPLFKIVQDSNMSKLDPETGEPIYNEFGKIQKGSAFKKPEPRIEREIYQQIKAAENQ